MLSCWKVHIDPFKGNILFMKDEGSDKGRARGEPAIEFEDHFLRATGQGK